VHAAHYILPHRKKPPKHPTKQTHGLKNHGFSVFSPQKIPYIQNIPHNNLSFSII
jgi:hypothetical protein